MTVRVFLVDDSATSRRVLRLLLGDLPGILFVGEASSGEEALARVGDARPDVVVVDWQMPGISGVEATARLLDEHPGVRVVGYTSSGDASTHRAFADAGAAAVFHKEDVSALRGWLEALAVG